GAHGAIAVCDSAQAVPALRSGKVDSGSSGAGRNARGRRTRAAIRALARHERAAIIATLSMRHSGRARDSGEGRHPGGYYANSKATPHVASTATQIRSTLIQLRRRKSTPVQL